MSLQQLQQLGLHTRTTEQGVEAELELVPQGLVNPISKTWVERVTFALVGDRLIPLEPGEVVGLPPIPLAGLVSSTDLSTRLSTAYSEAMFHMQRRSAQLQALGLIPRVDPTTLQLSADLKSGGFHFQIAADKRGNFRVTLAAKEGRTLDVATEHVFELTEFRERGALIGYLAALFGGEVPAPAPPRPLPVKYADVAERIGEGATVPPTSPVELLVQVRVRGKVYRFAAARVTGRTFRGLLAGTQGKLWAERFELDEFPGVRALVAQVLRVSSEEIEMNAEEQ